MPGDPKRRFDLIFAGELLPDTTPADARATLAGFFGIADADRVELFFRGRALPLRRDLGQRDAARLYREMRSAGLLCELRPRSAPAENADDPGATATPGSDEATPDATVAAADGGEESAAPRRESAETEAPTSAAKTQTEHRPNLFALRPAPPCSATPDSLFLTSLLALGVGASLLLLLIALQLRFPPPRLEPPPPISEAAAATDGRLLLLMGQRLLIHGRSGRGLLSLEAAELGLAGLQAPLLMDVQGRLLIGGRRSPGEAARLWRCDLQQRHCSAATTEPVQALAIATDALGDLLFIHSSDGELLRVSAQAEILARARLALPPGRPRLLNVDGLLLAPMAEGPLIGVYRSDMGGFGTQVDGLLPLSRPALADPSIVDISATNEGYSVLFRGEDGEVVTHYDRQWQAREGARIPQTSAPGFIVHWSNSAVLGPASHGELLRFAWNGEWLTALNSDLVEAEYQRWQTLRTQSHWRHRGNLLALCAALIATLMAGLQYLAGRSFPEPVGACMALNSQDTAVQWININPRADLRRRTAAVAIPLTSIAAMPALGSGAEALCLLPALAGGLLATRDLWSQPGHIGLLGNALLAIDHKQSYTIQARQALRRSRHWLLLDRVAVPMGLPGLPHLAPDTSQLNALAAAAPCSGAELLARLWLLRQPWFMAALWSGGGWLLSLLLLGLGL